MLSLTNFCYILVYSFIGWILEMGFWFLQEGYFINRGFLTGPLCPMYGIGFFFILRILKGREYSLKATFAICIAVAAFMEQATGYILEKIFKLRLWDYSYSDWNINGNLSLKNLIIFGAVGVIFIRLLHPFVKQGVEKIPYRHKRILVFVFALGIGIDILFTILTLNSLSINFKKTSFVDIQSLLYEKKSLFKAILKE